MQGGGIAVATERACLMVWDGLRPDQVSAETTPNLWQLAQQGVWFERSYAVYPTLTRANSPEEAMARRGRAGSPRFGANRNSTLSNPCEAIRSP